MILKKPTNQVMLSILSLILINSLIAVKSDMNLMQKLSNKRMTNFELKNQEGPQPGH